MSHFTVGVLIPADTPEDELEARIAERLAKYDENTEVEPYKVHMDASAHKGMADYYKVPMEDTDTLLAKMRDWNGAKECGVDEEGIWYTRTYNPHSKWDWWTIGGRWEGRLHGNNMCLVSELTPEDSFFAIVTDDGEWHQSAQMGWWGMTSDEQEPEKWEAERAEILSGHANHAIVLVDCHI